MAEVTTGSEKYPNLRERVEETLYTLLHPQSEVEADIVYGAFGAFLGGVASGGNAEVMLAATALSTLLKPATSAAQKFIDRDKDAIVPDHILKVLYNSAKSFATAESPYDKR